MRIAPTSAARILVAAACAALLAFAMSSPAAGAQEQARTGHQLTKKLPKKWLKAYKLRGAESRPLADPDRDGACNWVEFTQRTHPRKRNRVMETPPVTDVPASRIILLEGTVLAADAAGFTVQLDNDLVVKVAMAPTAPVVDGGGLPATLAPGQGVHAFVRQTSDLALTAVLVFVDDAPVAEPEDPAAPGEEPVADDVDGEDDDGHHGRGDPAVPCPPKEA